MWEMWPLVVVESAGKLEKKDIQSDLSNTQFVLKWPPHWLIR